MIYIDYTVTFKDAEGGVLSEEIYHYGNKVSEPATPVKNADKTYTYTFKGWDKKVVDCIANVEYRAQFDSVYIDYTICFVANNNEIALYTLHYGDAIVIPEAPNRDGYAFKGWSPNVEYTATGNKTYTAQYDKLYTVKVEGGTVNNASSAVISNGSSVTIRANVAVNNAPFKTNVNTISTTFKRLFPKRHPHELRYNFITRAKESGCNLEAVMLWAGHSFDKDVKSSAVDRGYTDYSNEYLIQEAQKIDYPL